MNNIILCCCDDVYVPKSIISLNLFVNYNPTYKKAIIGTKFNDESKYLFKEHNIIFFEVDLSNDFIELNNRPYGNQYPIQCFYHFYAYKLFHDYDFIIQIEADVYTNKKINIDLKAINYVGGSHHPNNTIRKFGVINKDYNKLKKIYGNGDINQPRICSGVKIYNVKGLNRVNFYEQIVEYYQTSIKINCPRCGDDSLMVMYQLFNSSHITLLKPKFHVINYSKVQNYNNVTFFHFAGQNPKYWKVQNSMTLKNIQRFFYDNMIQYIYNNYTLDFIKKYVPEIFVDVTNVKIKFYYFNGENNFGDLITPYLLNKYCKDFSFCKSNQTITDPKIMSCGSIMRLCDENTIVYGSGIRDIDQYIKKGIIKFVRGPLTRKRLIEIGCYCPQKYGDPGLLLPLYYNPIIPKKYKIGIIPHYIHYDKIEKMYKNVEGVKVINLINTNIELVIDDILSCEKTISSSLHGLIVSDAYSIPNVWVKFDNKIKGDDTKFYDYFLSVNRLNINFIDCMDDKKIPDDIYSMIRDSKISFDVNELQNNFFMDKNGIRNYTKYLYKNMVEEA
jgi:pyruvyltransferase